MSFLCSVAAEMSPPFVLGSAHFPSSQGRVNLLLAVHSSLSLAVQCLLPKTAAVGNPISGALSCSSSSGGWGGWKGVFGQSVQLAGFRVGGCISALSPSQPSPGCGKVGSCKPRKAAGSGRAELVCPGQGLRGLTRLLAAC